MMTSGRARFASPWTRSSGACQTDTNYPDIFPFPFPFPQLALALPHPLSAVSRHPHIQSWIVILSPPQNNALSLLFFSLVSVTTSPCHLIFHIPFGCLDQPHLARDGQTSPITSSNPISDPKIPAHLPQGSCFVSSPQP